MPLNYTYINAISDNFPNVGCHAIGDDAIYENIVHDNGDPIPDKATLDALIAAKVKDHMWRQIQAERDRRKAGGVKVNGNWFHSDDPSRIQQLGLMMMGASMPPGIMWKTMSGTFVQMTPTLAQQIFQAVAAADQSIFAVAEQHKAAMMASSDPAIYSFSSGWPLVYGE